MVCLSGLFFTSFFHLEFLDVWAHFWGSEDGIFVVFILLCGVVGYFCLVGGLILRNWVFFSWGVCFSCFAINRMIGGGIEIAVLWPFWRGGYWVGRDLLLCVLVCCLGLWVDSGDWWWGFGDGSCWITVWYWCCLVGVWLLFCLAS